MAKRKALPKAELLRRCGLEIEAELAHGSGVFEEIRSQVVPPDLAAGDAFNRSAHLGRELFDFIQPPPDMRLGNALTSLFRQLAGERPLTLDDLYRAFERFAMDCHIPEYDKFPCLNQPDSLSTSDNRVGRGYRRRMKVEQKEDWSTLAKRLIWAMDQSGQDDHAIAALLSKMVGRKVPWQTIQGIRRGKSQSSRYITQISEILGCSTAWLATGKGDPYVAKMALPPISEITPATVAMAKRWQALPPNLQSNMYTVLLAFEALSRG
jgi:hypothetical protein